MIYIINNNFFTDFVSLSALQNNDAQILVDNMNLMMDFQVEYNVKVNNETPKHPRPCFSLGSIRSKPCDSQNPISKTTSEVKIRNMPKTMHGADQMWKLVERSQCSVVLHLEEPNQNASMVEESHKTIDHEIDGNMVRLLSFREFDPNQFNEQSRKEWNMFRNFGLHESFKLLFFRMVRSRETEEGVPKSTVVRVIVPLKKNKKELIYKAETNRQKVTNTFFFLNMFVTYLCQKTNDKLPAYFDTSKVLILSDQKAVNCGAYCIMQQFLSLSNIKFSPSLRNQIYTFVDGYEFQHINLVMAIFSIKHFHNMTIFPRDMDSLISAMIMIAGMFSRQKKESDDILQIRKQEMVEFMKKIKKIPELVKLKRQNMNLQIEQDRKLAEQDYYTFEHQVAAKQRERAKFQPKKKTGFGSTVRRNYGKKEDKSEAFPLYELLTKKTQKLFPYVQIKRAEPDYVEQAKISKRYSLRDELMALKEAGVPITDKTILYNGYQRVPGPVDSLRIMSEKIINEIKQHTQQKLNQNEALIQSMFPSLSDDETKKENAIAIPNEQFFEQMNNETTTTSSTNSSINSRTSTPLILPVTRKPKKFPSTSSSNNRSREQSFIVPLRQPSASTSTSTNAPLILPVTRKPNMSSSTSSSNDIPRERSYVDPSNRSSATTSSSTNAPLILPVTRRPNMFPSTSGSNSSSRERSYVDPFSLPSTSTSSSMYNTSSSRRNTSTINRYNDYDDDDIEDDQDNM